MRKECRELRNHLSLLHGFLLCIVPRRFETVLQRQAWIRILLLLLLRTIGGVAKLLHNHDTWMKQLLFQFGCFTLWKDPPGCVGPRGGLNAAQYFPPQLRSGGPGLRSRYSDFLRVGRCGDRILWRRDFPHPSGPALFPRGKEPGARNWPPTHI
jgi:hypothetical protein